MVFNFTQLPPSGRLYTVHHKLIAWFYIRAVDREGTGNDEKNPPVSPIWHRCFSRKIVEFWRKKGSNSIWYFPLKGWIRSWPHCSPSLEWWLESSQDGLRHQRPVINIQQAVAHPGGNLQTEMTLSFCWFSFLWILRNCCEERTHFSSDFIRFLAREKMSYPYAEMMKSFTTCFQLLAVPKICWNVVLCIWLLVGGKIQAPPRFAMGVQQTCWKINQPGLDVPLGGPGIFLSNQHLKNTDSLLRGSVWRLAQRALQLGARASRNWNAHRSAPKPESVVFHCGMVRTCKPCPGTASCLSYWSQNLRIT